MNIIWPNNTTDIIDQIRGAIGREVIFYTLASSVTCTVCGLDPITNTAIDSFCPTCSGKGVIEIFSGVSISGHVNWGYSEHLGWVSGGQLQQGDCRVQIKYSPTNESVVDSSRWILVDGRNMEIIKRTLRGVPTINRILLDLKERDRENE